MYNADIGRFLRADTIVPEPGNPRSLNRYSYGFRSDSYHPGAGLY